jgi:digeranylgeranylglycerophospholipid reductase
MKYDVIVVGAGPAGSATAKAVAEKGAEVIVLEKRAEIGVPVQCGEAFGKTGMTNAGIKPSPKWIAKKLKYSCLVSPNGSKICFKNDAYVIERRIFDKHLAVQAAKAGAQYKVRANVLDLKKTNGKFDKVVVESFGEKEEFKGKIVVGADGFNSKVARWTDMARSLSTKYSATGLQYEMVNMDLESHETEYIFFGRDVAPGGYAWIFPKGKDVANVGLGFTTETREPKNAFYYLKKFVKENEMTKNATPINIVAGGIPLIHPLKRTVKENVLLVGDAARQIYSLAGAGIGYSLLCGGIAGDIAGDAISEGAATEDRLMEYDKEWRSRFGKELELAFQVKEIVIEFTDEELDKLAKVILDIGMDNLTKMNMTKAIAKILIKFKPTLVTKLGKLLYT